MNKLSLVNSPTPLQFLDNLSSALDVEIWIKRDDLTGDFMLGGNKLRKFEYIFADALKNGADTLIFAGGPQSNMIRAGIALANRLGLRSVAAYMCEKPESCELTANRLLNSFSDITVEYLGKLALEELPTTLKKLKIHLQSLGRRPYVVPLGASTPLTVSGYIDAVQEVNEQEHIKCFDAHYLAVGSAGTYAGVAVGLEKHGCIDRLRGISVLATSQIAAQLINNLINSYSKHHCLDSDINDKFIGAGYGVPTSDGLTALRTLLNSEGIMLDHVYTAKTFAALLDDVKTGLIPKAGRVLFWHTGGTSGLFALNSANII
ncbi:MAG: pyridoxal-phosphate dependent enzyme [Negativicutes bacterium]|jgi:1-aminocyclopropane-1-carboxylate deaminase/D-cysteine desulfhydrase-like pyridoxal-dependent ACC family enzyme